MKQARKVALSIALLAAVASFSSFAWAGDVKGKVAVQGMRSAANISASGRCPQGNYCGLHEWGLGWP
jgi:hypothetical protein